MSTTLSNSPSVETPAANLPKVRPTHEVSEQQTHWEVVVELPGVTKESISLKTENHQLVLEAPTAALPKEWELIRAERCQVEFNLRIQFPENAPIQDATAKSENGILRIFVPKAPEVQPKTLVIH